GRPSFTAPTKKTTKARCSAANRRTCRERFPLGRRSMMRYRRWSHQTALIAAAAVVLTGCGAQTGAVPQSGRVPGQTSATKHRLSRSSASYNVLYRFDRNPDGESPEGGLVDLDGALYGTTFEGGDNTCHKIGCGTAFSITPTGAEQLLFSFDRAHGEN